MLSDYLSGQTRRAMHRSTAEAPMTFRLTR